MNNSPEQVGSYLWAKRVARSAAAEKDVELADDLDTARDDWIARALEMPAHRGNRRTAVIAGKPYHWVGGGASLSLRTGGSPW